MSDQEFGDSWNVDKLNRKEESEFLTQYLVGKSQLENNGLNNGSFVLNVNAEWGFGKTYFLRNWADDLASDDYPVVYFDAWENDFSKEPLVAFISTINAQLEPYFNKKIGTDNGTRVMFLLSDWLDKGKKILQPTSPILLGILAKKLTGMTLENITDLLDDDIDEAVSIEEDQDETSNNSELKQDVSTVISKAASSMLESHNATKKTIVEFKASLKKLTDCLDTLESINTPIFIFVDELDRCRPNYAIELLEKIKHLFGVPRVYFVVATASEQLCHSIKKVYGQDFDSPNYLKRFFDQTYTLQEPNRHSYAEYLFNQYGLANRENLFSPLDQTLFPDKNINSEAFAFVADSLNFGLRDMIQYCVLIDSISLTFKKAPIHLIYLLFLVWLKNSHNKIYALLLTGRVMTSDDLQTLDLDMVNVIATHSQQDHFRSAPSKISVGALMQIYINFSRMDADDLCRNLNSESGVTHIENLISQTLSREISRSYPNGSTPRNSLSCYPKLIEQAGLIT